MKKILLCNTKEIIKNKFYIKYIEELKDEIIAFFDDEQKNIKVFSSICPHFGGPLFYDKKKIICKWHNWKFCKNSGKCLTYPIKATLDSYEFEVNPDPLKEYKSYINNNQLYIITKNIE
jgi:nitrite reductase/ring-hydroxylating ferredoxin subunit